MEATGVMNLPKKKGFNFLREKDPLKPKTPLTAFFKYMQTRRAALREKNVPFTQIGKIAGEEWRNMTPLEREKWRDNP
jgi:upstream-binding transcription factor